MKNLLTYFFAFLLTWAAALEMGIAQSRTDRRPPGNSRTRSSPERPANRKGLFNRLFEQRQSLDTADQKRVASAVQDVAGSEPSAEEALLKAREALEANPDAVDQAQKALLENKDMLLEQGTRLLEENAGADVVKGLPAVDLGTAVDGVLGSGAASSVRSMVSPAAPFFAQSQGGAPRAKAEVAAAPQPSTRQPVRATPLRRAPSTSGSAGPRLLPVDPSAIPQPHDPIRTAIPRPELDPNRKLTRITAESSAFDANTNVVNFEGNVELDHPDFDMTCDILVAELANSNGGASESSESATQRASSGGIEKATATGYVVIEKLTPDGTQVAKARKAVYDAVSGIVTLSDFPVMQDGKNIIRGTEASTRIFLRPDGKYNVDGPAKYEIQTDDNSINVPKR